MEISVVARGEFFFLSPLPLVFARRGRILASERSNGIYVWKGHERVNEQWHAWRVLGECLITMRRVQVNTAKIRVSDGFGV